MQSVCLLVWGGEWGKFEIKTYSRMQQNSVLNKVLAEQNSKGETPYGKNL
jgi:hypothetical protein